MIKIQDFLSNIKLSDSNKADLEYIWGELDSTLKKISEYSEDIQLKFLRASLLSDLKNSFDIENALYSPYIFKMYDEGLITNSKLSVELIRLLNKNIRAKERIMTEVEFEKSSRTNLLNETYEEYCAHQKYNLEGNFRLGMVWVGGDTIDKAKFIPPTSEEIPEYIDDFIKFYNSEYSINPELEDPIVKAALLHVLFIKIHPFSDGNGRVARILINGYLSKGFNEKLGLNFTYPPINLSSSFNRSKDDYSENQNAILFENNVDNNEAINKWVRYIIYCLEEQVYYLNSKFEGYDKLANRGKHI